MHTYYNVQHASRKPIRSAFTYRFSPSRLSVMYKIQMYSSYSTILIVIFSENTKRAPIHKGRETRGATFVKLFETATPNGI